MNEPTLEVVTVPVDQGLCDALAREGGREDAADLIARDEAQRAAMDPATLAVVDEMGHALECAVLGIDAY